MSDMTLVEALRECGPGVGDPAVDARRTAAQAVLYERLQVLARKVRPDGSAEDVASVVAIRLIQSGPRGQKPNDPYGTEELVDAYLIRALRNGLIDEIRRGKRTEAFDEKEKSPWADLERHLELERARNAISQAVACVFGDIVAGQRDSVRQAIEARREVAEGRKTFDACIREELGEVSSTTRNRFYQRQKRAMTRLADAVEDYILTKRLSALDAGALRIVVTEMKHANAGWPVGDREA